MGVIGRRNGTRDDTVEQFQAFLDSRLRPLEEAAAVTAGEIGVEADRLRGKLGPRGVDSQRIDGLAERLARSTATFAEDVARMRVALASNGSAPTPGAPSEGVELLVRQMSVAGADLPEIEARLASLGVERPHEVTQRLLGD